MSIRQLQTDIRKAGGYILSDGTCNLQHLLPKAYDVLQSYNIQSKELKKDILDCFTITYDEYSSKHSSLFYLQYHGLAELNENNHDQTYTWYESVFNYFSKIAPNGYYFGSSEGDGACIGWFKYEKEAF